jgi:hypothetical protein
MKDNVYRFRSLKHGDPKKLKMIPDQPSATSARSKSTQNLHLRLLASSHDGVSPGRLRFRT